MKDNFTIREWNIPAHTQMEIDIIKRGKGNVTFTLRVNDGNIVDYNPVEYRNIKEIYGKFTRLIPKVRKKPNIPRNS